MSRLCADGQKGAVPKKRSCVGLQRETALWPELSCVRYEKGGIWVGRYDEDSGVKDDGVKDEGPDGGEDMRFRTLSSRFCAAATTKVIKRGSRRQSQRSKARGVQSRLTLLDRHPVVPGS